ncbi:sensor domain-containing diguanylate cyclase [Pulveribacter suum]|uniref:Sensor domain-containing diguanylate cyclase n=2 Tax=Pulveribacter suum TaxID=2116657 RepID=A0A2P1NPZ5_9BURK|nr:sensor domain-containing diguanylate cyclase [Pulveribacter suum]
MAVAASVQVQTLLSGLDYTLASLSTVYATGGDESFARAVGAVHDAYPPGIVMQIAVANAAGDIVYSNLEPGGAPPAAVSIRDREHFQVHANGRAQGMYVSRPVLGRVSQRWAVQLSRAVRGEGGFRGVMVLSLSPDYIAHYLQALSGGTGDVVSLVRSDGAYVARSLRQEEVLGQSLPPGRLEQAMAARERGGQSRHWGGDGAQWLRAWSQVPGQPLVAGVELDRQAAHAQDDADWRRVLWRNGVGTGLVLSGSLLAAWLALQRQRSEQMRRRAEQRFARLAQEAPGGLFQCRQDARGALQLVFSTPQFHALHGLRPGAGSAGIQGLQEGVWPEDLPALASSVQSSLQGRDAWDHRYRVRDNRAPDGWRWLHGYARTQQEEDGTLLWHGFVHDVTQDQAAQEATRQSEERLRMTVRAVRDGLWEWDCSHGRVHWDARCFDMLGYADAALQLDIDTFLAMVHPGDLGHVKERLARHVGQSEEFRVEMRLRTANAGWRSIESRGEVTLRDAHGRALRMLGTHTDIHERVEQARLISALLDKGSALVFVASPQRDILYANERAALAFGLAAGTQEQPQSLRLLHPDEASFRRFAQLYDSLREQSGLRIEWLLRLGDGSQRWFDMQGRLLDPHDSEGNVVWTLVDIDARRRAESSLMHMRRTLGAIIDRFPSGILVADEQGLLVVAANQELVEILQLQQEPSTLVGMPLAQLQELLPSPLDETLLQRTEGGDFRVGTSVQPLADGRHLEVGALALRDAGQAIGHCWVISDVTERRQRERQLETMALTDALTGVPNRRAFMERLDTEIGHLQAGLVPHAALLMLDIDHFKRVNDTWGHAVGDIVLRDLAQGVSRMLRRQDMVGRMGGEEFAVLLSGAGVQAAHQRAEELRRAVQAREIRLDDGTVLRITISLGVYGLTAQDADGSAGLERADAAMYFSKRNGRNQSTVWRADLPALGPPESQSVT